MSAADAVRFMVHFGSDPKLHPRLQDTHAALAKLGADHGFTFSEQELAEVMRAELGELTDEQLANATGGTNAASSAAFGSTTAPTDPSALVQHVLKESYLEQTEDLRFYAEKVKYFNQSKKLVRDHLQSVR